MMSHTTRLPSPPPPEDTRAPSPARVDSPPAPTQTSPRQDVPTASIADADITPSVDPPTELVTSVTTLEVSHEIPLIPPIPTATPTPAEDITILAPSETIVPPSSKDVTPSAEVAAP